MTLKLAYLNKKKPIEKSKYEPNYKQEAKKAYERNKAEITIPEDEYREIYERHLKKYYQ